MELADRTVVPDGGYQVHVSTIIHPAAFWVVDPAGPDSGRGKVNDLERKISRSVKSNERISTDVNHWVAIRNPNTGAWHRGLVHNIVQIGDKYIYVVFLVDHGTCLQVDVDSLAELSRNFLRFTFQAFEVVLDGIEPQVQDNGRNKSRWPEAALTYVSQLLDTVLYTYFVPAGVVGTKIYGELYLQCGNECKALSALLCSKGCAKKCCSVLKSGGLEEGMEKCANSTENIVNGVEIDDRYISNYYIRMEKKNMRPSKKINTVPTKAGIKEPELATFEKTEAVTPKPELCKSSPNKGSYLLKSMEELMKKDDFLVHRSSFKSSQQTFNLRPASDTRAERDKNAGAMYENKTLKCDKVERDDARRQTSNKSHSFSNNVESSVGNHAECGVIKANSGFGVCDKSSSDVRVQSNVDSAVRVFEEGEEWTVRSPSISTQGQQVKTEALDEHLSGDTSSEQATLCKMTDDFRSRFDSCQLRDTLDMSRILVHSHVPLEPVESLKDACFPTQIHKALEKLDFKSAFNIQLYAWKAILQGRNTFLVGPARSGKTLSYILPLLSKCVSGTAFQQAKPGNAPNILVLCPGYETARFVYYVCSKILHLAGICHVDIILTHGGGAEMEVMTQLLHGCHILISTPRCWLRLYQRSELLTNLSRLRYIVLEDADVLISKFPEVKHIMQLCKKISSAQNRDIWTICVTETWTKYIRGLAAGFTENACVCFGSCLEAAVYANLKPNLYFIDAEAKDKKVIRLVRASYSLQRTVVVCLTSVQVNHLVGVLEEANIKVLGAHEEIPNYDLSEIRCRWLQSRRGNFPVLVCSDDVLLEMNVTDASVLIHYNLPTSSKTQFGFRFSCLMNNFQNIFSSADIMNLDCTVHILVQSGDIQQFPTLINLMKRLGGVLSPEVEAKYTEVLEMQEKQKVSSPFCHNVKAFGSCWKMQKCPSRHFFDRSLDVHLDLPHDGQVKVKVVHVHSANCFSVRLLEHWSSDGTRTLVANQYLDVAFKLDQWFSDLENRIIVAAPTEGRVYAVSRNGYHRVICEKVEKKDVKVRFIDEGSVKTCKAYDLMPLPEDLQCVPPQVVEVILCEVAPHDNDTVWSMLATQAAFDWVSETADSEDVGVYLAGKVVLSLGRTLWLSPLMSRQYLPDIKTDIFVSSLKRDLVQSGYAVPNPGHIDKLYEICKEAGIFMETALEDECGSLDNDDGTDKTQRATPQEDEACQEPSESDGTVRETQEKCECPQETSEPKQLLEWESLSRDVCEVDLSLVSPGEFYVQKKAHSQRIEELTGELQEYIANHFEAITAEPGLYCLGKWPEDNLWYRAKITEVFEDDRIELFSVDLGDFTIISSKDIAVLPDKFIDKLPFQAIECELASVKPCHGDVWEESVNEEFYTLAGDEFSWSVEVLASSEPSTTGGRKYSVRLQGLSECGCIDVNGELLNLGLAASTDPRCAEADFDVEFTEEEILDLFHKGKNTESSPVCESNKVVEVDEPRQSCPSSCPSEVVPLLASCAKTPRLTWYQNAHVVCFEIQVPGADGYSAQCTSTHFQFRAAVSGDVYYVSLFLCGVVEPQESLCAQVVGGFRIKLRKQTAGFKWPHLVIPLKNAIKANWSLEHVDDPTETEGAFTGFLPQEYKSDESEGERAFLSESDGSGDESTPFA